MRVYKARAMMPAHVPLRVFRRPEECVEVWGVLDGVNGTGANRKDGAAGRVGDNEALARS